MLLSFKFTLHRSRYQQKDLLVTKREFLSWGKVSMSITALLFCCVVWMLYEDAAFKQNTFFKTLKVGLYGLLWCRLLFLQNDKRTKSQSPPLHLSPRCLRLWMWCRRSVKKKKKKITISLRWGEIFPINMPPAVVLIFNTSSTVSHVWWCGRRRLQSNILCTCVPMLRVCICIHTYSMQRKSAGTLVIWCIFPCESTKWRKTDKWNHMITFDCFVITQNGCWKIVLVNGLHGASFVILFYLFIF